MIHKKVPINPISPTVQILKAPQACNTRRSKPKVAWWLSRGSASVLALWCLPFPSNAAVAPPLLCSLTWGSGRPYMEHRAFLSPWKKTGRTRIQISTTPRISPKLMTIDLKPYPDTKEVKNGRNLLRIYLQPQMLRWTPVELNQWL